MLIKYTERNKYGGYTWEISLGSPFKIQIHGTDNTSFIVELKEWKWLNYKTHFAFVSNDSLEKTIRSSFDRVFEFFKNYKDLSWTYEEKEFRKQQTLNELYF